MLSIKRIIVSALFGWLTAISVTLIISLAKFETPGIPDIIGFGSYFLIGSAAMVPLCYLPMLYAIRRWLPEKINMLPLALCTIANTPLFIVLWLQAGSGFFLSEAFLFIVGFFLLALVFGAGLIWNVTLTSSQQKVIITAFGLAVVLFNIFFDYQVLYQDASHGIVRPAKQMNARRSAHTATVLNDGKVLIVGGILVAEGVEVNNASTDIFDPQTETCSPGPVMSQPRAGHTATRLADGNVLIAGGFDAPGFLASAELYFSSTGTFVKLKSEMSDKRAGHTATLLQNGKVLLVGGVNGSTGSNRSVDLYDPSLKTFKKVSELLDPRTGHSATLLPRGKVLIAGGSSQWRSDVLATSELFNPENNSLEPAAHLNTIRNKHLALLMNDGKVLLIGGSFTASEIGGRYYSAEVYDPEKNQFTWLSAQLIKSRFKITNAGDVMTGGAIVIAGDGKYVEVYDPGKNLFFTVQGNVEKAWMYPAVTTISENRALITGGYDSRMQTTDGVWIFEAARNATKTSSLVSMSTLQSKAK